MAGRLSQVPRLIPATSEGRPVSATPSPCIPLSFKERGIFIKKGRLAPLLDALILVLRQSA